MQGRTSSAMSYYFPSKIHLLSIVWHKTIFTVGDLPPISNCLPQNLLHTCPSHLLISMPPLFSLRVPAITLCYRKFFLLVDCHLLRMEGLWLLRRLFSFFSLTVESFIECKFSQCAHPPIKISLDFFLKLGLLFKEKSKNTLLTRSTSQSLKAFVKFGIQVSPCAHDFISQVPNPPFWY